MTASNPPGVAHPRAIRSFVRRAGRITTGQTKAFATLGPQFVLPHALGPLDADLAWAGEAEGASCGTSSSDPGRR